MSLTFNGTNITAINYNGTALTKVIFNGTTVWESTSWHTQWTGSKASGTAIGSTLVNADVTGLSNLRTSGRARITGNITFTSSIKETLSAIETKSGSTAQVTAVSVTSTTTIRVVCKRVTTRTTASGVLTLTKVEQYY